MIIFTTYKWAMVSIAKLNNQKVNLSISQFRMRFHGAGLASRRTSASLAEAGSGRGGGVALGMKHQKSWYQWP
jgi:hypothetical protein